MLACNAMKQPVRVATITIGVLLVSVGVANRVLMSSSFPYACWRVCHPFGPDCDAFDHVIKLSTTARIAELIERVDTADGWWIESLFQAWFPVEHSPPSSKREFYSEWWKVHHSEYQSGLVLKYDPQF